MVCIFYLVILTMEQRLKAVGITIQDTVLRKTATHDHVLMITGITSTISNRWLEVGQALGLSAKELDYLTKANRSNQDNLRKVWYMGISKHGGYMPLQVVYEILDQLDVQELQEIFIAELVASLIGA